MKLLAPNTLLQNRYLIVHLIGKGGMGEVYLAVDQRLGSVVALKRTFFSDDKLLGGAFEREARTLARLRHPVLPKVSDHFIENETQYLAMEHISGEDLSERLKTNKKPFPVNWVLFWADQLLDALSYLHSHEPPIVHRDIKPQNLKLTDENHIVLLDFGLAKNSLGETRVTTSGSVVGYTPHYAPLEQIRGTGTDARSDIYSLSATLYQILTNTVPPDALTRVDAIISGLSDPIKPINEINPEVSKSVSDVILKGLSISQEPRYASARQMQKVLRDAFAQLGSESSEQTIAFNTQDVAEISLSKRDDEFKTTPPIISKIPGTDLHSQTNSKAANSAPLPGYGKTFDSTQRYDSKTGETGKKQSDIKTEVFLGGSSPEIAAVQENNPVQENSKSGNSLKQTRNFSIGNGSSQPENYTPEATAPLISFDEKEDYGFANQMRSSSEFDSIPRAPHDEFASVPYATNVGVAQEVQHPAVNHPSDSSVRTTPVKPKSKSLPIFGGLAALLLLVVGAAGLGWYMLHGSAKTVETSAPPTPEATVSTAPTPEPSFEAVTNSNTSNESDISASNTNSQTAEQTDGEKSSETNTNNEKPTQTSPQPAPVRVSTPKPVPAQTQAVRTVTPKPVPQPTKPKKPERGGIDQIFP